MAILLNLISAIIYLSLAWQDKRLKEHYRIQQSWHGESFWKYYRYSINLLQALAKCVNIIPYRLDMKSLNAKKTHDIRQFQSF